MEQTKTQNGFLRRVRMQTRNSTQRTVALPKQFINESTAKAYFPRSIYSQSYLSFDLQPQSRIIYDCSDPLKFTASGRCIAGKFAETLFSGGTFQTIVSTTDYSLTTIEQRYDDMQWDAYQLKKKHMAKQLGGEDKVNEMWLWHGTAPSATRSLLLNGFERNFGYKMAYGDGVYFAVNSSYSFYDSYAKPEKNAAGRDEKVLLLSRVLVGQTCQGVLSMKTPDTKSDGTFCNSMTNNIQNPEMYILSAGSDNQSYIEFVLRFER